ncbi:choice-of-anchor Q domain-containing protein [Aquisphaera insulae]|uniref:choice-of-anchor Q domain-containing protein n=1 Tax=Aquisphaera insulae TaxID=2712864 RepID=UPI0013EA9644|nr:choice-of-anchor Q domain-containing protein [Aquisphaera insulae]
MKVSTASDQRSGGRGSVEARRRQRRRLRPSLMALEDRQLLSMFTVTSTLDDGSEGTLRWAVGQANSTVGADTIDFDSSFNTPRKITLLPASGGQLTLTDTATTTINGPGAGLLSISGNNTSRVFAINPGGAASISGVTITGGRVTGSGSAGRGGGVANFGTTTLTDCTVSGNRATVSGGGGLYNATGTLTVDHCIVSGNTSNSGGLANFANGTLILTQSTVSGNSGSGVANNSGMVTLTGCTLSGNSSMGLIGSGGTAALTNCTVSGNFRGMSILSGTATLTNCTVGGNSELGLYSPISGILNLGNTIVAGNGSFDARGQFASRGNNLIGTSDLSSGWIGSDLTGTSAQPLNAVLAPLGNYGGPTMTMALLPGSPAIDAGASGVGIPTTDQRGVGRIGGVDIGAFESSGFTLAYTAGSGQSASGAFPDPLVATVTTNSPLEPVAGGLVTFTPPASGASATFSSDPAVIGGDGTASATPSSNFIGGTYTVSATAAGATGAASYILTNYAVVSIAVTPGDPSLALGVAGQLTAMGTFADGSILDLTDAVGWDSGTPSVAAISGTGLATGLAVGTSKITASLDGVTSPDDTLTVIAPSFVVDTADDSFGFFSGTTSLREAIAGANAVPGQTITFDSIAFNTPQTITLGGTQLELSGTTGVTTITGPAGGVTVSGGGLSRVFQVDPNVTASISGLTITGGNAGYDDGGGLINLGTTALINCTISGNSTNGGGGGLATGSSSYPGATTALINCTISGNSSFAELGAYYGTTTLTNTIVAAVGGGFSIFGTVSGANNLIGTGGSGGLIDGVDGNIVDVADPGLAPLGDYGGTSPTMALLPGSPAIDAGTVAGAPATDQRGYARAGAVDIGAFESQGFSLTLVAGTPQSSDIGTPFADPLAVSVAAVNPLEPVDGGVVRFVAGRVGGATAILLAPSAVIAGGQAETTAAPNNALGSYTVIASSGALSTTFDLENTGTILSALVVNTTSDSLFPGPGLLSLREAVTFANLDTLGISSITFDPTLIGQTITLTGTQLELSNTTETVTITGPDGGVTVDAGGLSRVFQVDAGVTASLGHLTLTGGMTDGNGGGLDNLGTTTLTDCSLSGNSAGGNGGGLYNSGLATLNGTAVGDNYAYGDGGGFANPGNATLTDCTISGNTAHRSGGGIHSSGTLALNGSDVSGNSTTFYDIVGLRGSGGGLYNRGTATLSDCTIIGNTTSARSQGASGGGVAAGGGAVTTLTDCTISGNSTLGSASGGGGLFNGGGQYGHGGLDNEVASTAVVNRCVITGNSSRFYGGGLADFGMVTVSGSTISGNSAASSGGGVSVGTTFDNYTAIATLIDCTIDDNSATGSSGGGVASWGATTLTGCTISGNFAGVSGGGVRSAAAANGVSAPASVTLTDCTISGNSAARDGGGVETGSQSLGQQVYQSATLLNHCTVSGNSAGGNGGGLDTGRFGTTTAINSTVSGNSAVNGGGLYAKGSFFYGNRYGTINLTNCTVSGNSASGNGGGLVNGSIATTTLVNTLVAVNTAGTVGPDALGTVVSNGNNLIGEVDGSSGWVDTDLTGTVATPLDPLLAPLGLYGGPTETMPLLPGSPAIDAGTAVDAPATDQRGLPRVGGVDIGAFESQGFVFTPVAGSTPQTAVVGTAFSKPLAVSVTANNPVEPVDGGVVTYTAPTAGASATLPAIDAVISGGLAGLTATANQVIGGYAVAATAAGASAFNFVLNNVASVNTALTSVGWGSQTATVAGRTNLPWANISRFVLTFNTPVTPTVADLVVTGCGGKVYPVAAVSIDGNTVTWTLKSPIVDPDVVTFAVNPLLAVFTTQLRILPGDVNDDGVVNSQDMVFVRNAYVKIGPPPSIDLIFLDLNGDGVIDINDYNIVRKNCGKKLS